jgi:hypothetical protein
LSRALESSAVFRSIFPSLAIFPLRPILPGPACTCRQGARCERIGKHPDFLWSKLEASQQVSGEPKCGYGVATGGRSGVFVVDLDSYEAIDRFTELGGTDDTFTVETSRGAHLYYRYPGFPVRTSAGDLATGIDIRGDGGFVCSPGSPHRSGALYTVAFDIPVAMAPAWLLAWPGLRAKPRKAAEYGAVEPVPISDPSNDYGQRRLAGAVQYLDQAALSIEGQRGRDTFFSVCCYLMRRLRLPLDIARDCVEVIYNPRLVAAGTTTWTREDIESRLASARDTSSNVPPGSILDESTWNEIQRACA